MIRRIHRTIFARVLAVCLLALAVSPVTAPFSVIDAGDFDQSQPLDAHHPAHDMAEAHLKVAPQLVVTAPDTTPVFVATSCDDHTASLRPVLFATAPRALSAVLRL